MDSTARKVEKRNRPPVSCEPCRTRKLKCNRALPCDACTKRSKAAQCIYAANANRSAPKAGASGGQGFKDRLESLENLVSMVVNKNSQHPSATYPSSEAKDGPPSGVMTPETPHLQESEDGQVNYIDPSHWQSILEDIREVKEYLSPPNTSPSNMRSGSSASPTARDAENTASRISLQHVLSFLPPQPICDMLVSSYFASRYMILGFIHPAKFEQEYRAFWDNPLETSPLWIALLLSILSITASLEQMAGRAVTDGETPISTVALQDATMQCLTLGHYKAANAYALEAYFLYLQSCFLTSRRITIDSWFDMGTIIRLAFRMGYHRDPDHLPGISVFDGEMRRRVWLNIVQVDALLSFQMGFPSMIPSQFCDARDPRNFEYSDLKMDMTVLPPARSLSEHTPVTYTIVKSSVMGVFKKIVHHMQLLTAPPKGSTLALEEEMRRVYSEIPEPYQRRDVSRSFTDPPGLILERSTIEILYLKGIIILLRRSVNYDQENTVCEPSRVACVEAALGILARQADLHQACQPGGRLYQERWTFGSLPTHDYLLAAMVVCLDLSVRMDTGAGKLSEVPDERDLEEREHSALRSAHAIWSADPSPTREIRDAVAAMDVIMKKLATKCQSSAQDPLSVADLHVTSDPEFSYAGTISHMVEGSETIDWALLDQYFQGMDDFDMGFSVGQ